MKVETLFNIQNVINLDWINYYIDYIILWDCFRKNETTEPSEKKFQKFFRKFFYIY